MTKFCVQLNITHDHMVTGLDTHSYNSSVHVVCMPTATCEALNALTVR